MGQQDMTQLNRRVQKHVFAVHGTTGDSAPEHTDAIQIPTALLTPVFKPPDSKLQYPISSLQVPSSGIKRSRLHSQHSQEQYTTAPLSRHDNARPPASISLSIYSL